MKKVFLIIAFAFVVLLAKNSFAQITIHEFPKPVDYNYGVSGIDLIYLTNGGEKICYYDTTTITILNEDYSVYKTINIPSFNNGWKIIYIETYGFTDKLWNLDDKIEFVAQYRYEDDYSGIDTSFVYNEEGVLIQNLKNNGFAQKFNNKWIYIGQTRTNYYIYDLPGSMPTSTKDKEIKILPSESNISVYPNPVNNEFTVFAPYTQIANIKIVGTDGKQIKSVNVNDRNEKKINISAADMQSGTYIMQLTTESGEKFIKKIVKQ